MAVYSGPDKQELLFLLSLLSGSPTQFQSLPFVDYLLLFSNEEKFGQSCFMDKKPHLLCLATNPTFGYQNTLMSSFCCHNDFLYVTVVVLDNYYPWE